MTLFDLVEEVQEKMHMGELEILDRVQRAWPSHTQFTPTQAALMVRAIQRDGQKERAATYTVSYAVFTSSAVCTDVDNYAKCVLDGGAEWRGDRQRQERDRPAWIPPDRPQQSQDRHHRAD